MTSTTPASRHSPLVDVERERKTRPLNEGQLTIERSGGLRRHYKPQSVERNWSRSVEPASVKLVSNPDQIRAVSELEDGLRLMKSTAG